VSEAPPQRYYEKYWSKGLGRWSPRDLKASAFEEKLLSECVPEGSQVLDFGCGDGSHIGTYLHSIQRDYTGVDISLAAVDICRARGLRASQYIPDNPLPFESESFDVVAAFEVLEHLFEPQKSVDEIRRVLRTGGKFIGSVPNAVHFGSRLLMAIGCFNPAGSPETSLKRPWADPHIRFFSKKNLIGFLIECNFKKNLIYGKNFSLVELPRLYRSPESVKAVLENLSRPMAAIGPLWPSLFSTRLYFVAQK
jgi:SAM-dependent methyltransferase